MVNGASIGLGVGLALVVGAGVAAFGGLLGDMLAKPNVAVHLAGGGKIAPSVRAVVRRTGADGVTEVITLVPAPLADGTLALALPESPLGMLTDLALMNGEQQLWHVSPQLLRLITPADGTEAPALVPLVAEPEALRPFLHGRFTCAMALEGQNVRLTRVADGVDLTLSVSAQMFPLHHNGADWADAASGTIFTPRAEGMAFVTLSDGSQARCTPALPAGLMPLDLAGNGWQLQADSAAIVLLRAGQPPLMLPASGTLAQMTGDRLDTVHYRAAGDGLKILATYATCSDDATGERRSWRVTVGLNDGTELLACAGDPVRDGDGDWKLTSLNAVYREFGGSFTLSARSFVAESYCHRHEGRVIREGGIIRLERESRIDLSDCPSRGKAMADALDAALASGIEVRRDKRGGLGLVGIGDDLTNDVYIHAERAGGS